MHIKLSTQLSTEMIFVTWNSKGDFWKAFTCFNCIMVSVKSVTNCSSYWLTLTPAISVRHFKETFRNMGTFKNCWGRKKKVGTLQKCCTAFLQLEFKFKSYDFFFCKYTLYISVLINLVSNIYPRGIQFRNRSKVSKVAWTKGAFWEFSCKLPFKVYDIVTLSGTKEGILKTSLKKCDLPSQTDTAEISEKIHCTCCKKKNLKLSISTFHKWKYLCTQVLKIYAHGVIQKKGEKTINQCWMLC